MPILSNNHKVLLSNQPIYSYISLSVKIYYNIMRLQIVVQLRFVHNSPKEVLKKCCLGLIEFLSKKINLSKIV